MAAIGTAALGATGQATADPTVAALASSATPLATSSAGLTATRSQALRRNWGVEIVGVKPVSSGYMLAFKYRVLDPDKARLLNERKVKPYLVDEATGTVLAVPAMENIGELRQGATPVADRIYFMVFGNPGKLVRSGSKVSIVAGDFRLEGLVVQ